jgi:DNA-binding XRE family transcriptional regulator
MTGDELLLLRRGANMTQGDLAKSIGYSRQAIVKWERGVHDIPSKMVQSITEACTNHIPKPAPVNTKLVKVALEQYTKLRHPPLKWSHAEIMADWAQNDYVPGEPEMAAIRANFPDAVS